MHEIEGMGRLTAEEINERIPPFADTDAGMRHEYPANYAVKTPFMPYEEYKEKLSRCFMMKRERGILEARLHTNGDSCLWGTVPHTSIHQFFSWAGQDHDNEVIIFGGTGKDFFKGFGVDDSYRDTSGPIPPMPLKDMMWKLYEGQYYDGTNDIEGQIFDVEVPTIGIWNGGAFHSDLFLLCDITLCTEDAWTTEQHFRLNMMPGDGVQIPWRDLMGYKRFAYAELTGEIITAKKAYELGMVNEILPDTEACYKRAWEIADLIMHSGNRLTRRLTVQQLRQPWRVAVANEIRNSFATEMYCTAVEESPHSQIYWECAKAEARAVMEAEKKGKIIKPRIGKFIEEDNPLNK